MNGEQALLLECEGERLVGILHAGAPDAETGVVILVGGPQYRAGSHRQFLLTARRFARAGIPVLRFDYRGMGDSEGRPRSFEEVDADIRSAIDGFCKSVPGLRGVVLMGLCDAASAALMYGCQDSRVAALILLNPWVRSTAGEAKAYLRHYYWKRLLQRSFWRKLASGSFSIRRSASDLLGVLKAAKRNGPFDESTPKTSFIERMHEGLRRLGRPILFIISGRDLTAAEFQDLVESDSSWQRSVRVPLNEVKVYPNADHTMSRRADLDAASDHCIEWVKALRLSGKNTAAQAS